MHLHVNSVMNPEVDLTPVPELEEEIQNRKTMGASARKKRW